MKIEKLIKILFVSFMMFLPKVAFGDDNVKPIVIPLWDEKAPQYNNGLPEGSEKREKPGFIASVTNPELLVYPASTPNGTTLLMCPGGGYYGVAIEHEGKQFAGILNDIGVNLAVLKYRMPNGHPEVPAEDVNRALEILKSNTDNWGINPEKIGIGGASAGGHLATTIATQGFSDGSYPAFQVLLYPVVTMDSTLTHPGSRELLLGPNPSPSLVEKYSNEKQVSGSTPRAFIALSADDTTVPVENSLQYFQELKNAGVPAAMFIYPIGAHGWGTNPNFTYHKAWTFELINWLNNLP